jgi:DNA-binding FrmR family transcriptional regulator
MAEKVVPKEALVKRLKRAEGQIRGIQKMIESGRECESVITQLAAVRSAIEGVTGLILENCTVSCFEDKAAPDYDNIESLVRAIAIWGRIHVGD